MADLLAALLDGSTPALGRLKVAQSLLEEDQAKTYFLLKWVCKELCLAYSKKNKTPPSHVTTAPLWGFLGTILEILIQADDIPTLNVALNMYIFQVWCRRGAKIRVCHVLISCREWVWSSSRLRLVLQRMKAIKEWCRVHWKPASVSIKC